MLSLLSQLLANEALSQEGLAAQGHGMLKTDIIDTGDTHRYAMDMPGFSKDEISISLRNGYMTVAAEKKEDKEEKTESRYIVRERSTIGSTRSFHVGSAVKEEDIKASLNNGVLTIEVAKKNPERKMIEIQ